MGEIAKYVLVEDEEKIKRVRQGIERKKEKYGKGYCPCVTPSHTARTLFVRVRSTVRRDTAAVVCTRNSNNLKIFKSYETLGLLYGTSVSDFVSLCWVS